MELLLLSALHCYRQIHIVFVAAPVIPLRSVFPSVPCISKHPFSGSELVTRCLRWPGGRSRVSRLGSGEDSLYEFEVLKGEGVGYKTDLTCKLLLKSIDD